MSHANGRRRSDWILSPDPHSAEDGPGYGTRVGVLALQGDFREHRIMLTELGCDVREVRRPVELEGLAGLVVPGGESTTIVKLMAAFGLDRAIEEFHRNGGVVYGTCAGLIVVARDTVEGSPNTLGLIDIVARRNAFGRQVASFEADLPITGFGEPPLRAVFIRAPWIESTGARVQVLATYAGHVVAARQGRVLVTAFHPELTRDSRMHELFLGMIMARAHESISDRMEVTSSLGERREVERREWCSEPSVCHHHGAQEGVVS